MGGGLILTLRPPGRGNWTPVVIRIEQSRHAPLPLYVVPGQRLLIGGQELRVVSVQTSA